MQWLFWVQGKGYNFSLNYKWIDPYMLVITLLKISTLHFNNDDGVRKADFIWYCEYHLKCNVLIKIFNLLVIFSFAVVWGMSNKGFWRCPWGLRFASMVSMVVTLFRISMLRSLFSLCWQWLIIPEGDKIKPFFLQF